MQGARLVNKGEKIGIKRNNQTFDEEYERNCIVSERKGIRAVCVLTPRLFSHSVKTVEHYNKDYHDCSSQVSKDWHSGDFDAKWKEKELHK